tara:strand:- start:105 stop:311 length:207 start_codon:yes stop_codon:yes gene_type:complete
MADNSPKEEVKGESTEDDVLDIDTNDDVLSGILKNYRLKNYSTARPARGARVSTSIVGASGGERAPPR